jgi:predicted kinase
MTKRPERSAPAPGCDPRRRRDDLGDRHPGAIARWLALRHERARPAGLPGGVEALVQELQRRRRAIAEGFPELRGADLQEIERAQREFLRQQAARLRDRERRGRVRGGLGPPLRLADLRVDADGAVERVPGDAAPDASPPRDTCVDAAGVALDLTRLGCGDQAERLLSAYAGAADDFAMYEVVDFYERTLALDRMAALAEGGDGPDAPREARVAEARALLLVSLATRRRPLLPPILVAVGGLVASGKSTVSRALAGRIGAPRIEADRVRDFLLGDRPGRAVHESQWARSLAPDFGERVYAELLHRAAIVLASGRPAVLDACFPRARQRAAAQALARSCGRPFLFVECRAEPDVVRSRIAARDAEADRPGWSKILDDLAAQWEPPDELDPDARLVLDTGLPVSEAEAVLDARLPTWPDARGD